MYKVGVVLLVFVFGILVGHLFQQEVPVAQAGVEGSPPPCRDINGDGLSNVTDAVFFLNWLFLGGDQPECQAQASVVGLPDTGAVDCHDTGGAQIDCAGRTCVGQDGHYETGCPPEGRFTDNGDGTVTDHCTGLMWQQGLADTDGDGAAHLTDAASWCDAIAYCEKLELGGHDDWRLPNVRELESIIDYGRFSPAADPVFGTGSWGYFWSATPSAGLDLPWIINFGSGQNTQAMMNNVSFVRAVRGGL